MWYSGKWGNWQGRSNSGFPHLFSQHLFYKSKAYDGPHIRPGSLPYPLRLRMAFRNRKTTIRVWALGGEGRWAAERCSHFPLLLRVCEAAQILWIPGEVFLPLLPLLCWGLHTGPNPHLMGLQKVPSQQFFQAPVGHHLAPTCYQSAECGPQSIGEGEGAGSCESKQLPLH